MSVFGFIKDVVGFAANEVVNKVLESNAETEHTFNWHNDGKSQLRDPSDYRIVLGLSLAHLYDECPRDDYLASILRGVGAESILKTLEAIKSGRADIVRRANVYGIEHTDNGSVEKSRWDVEFVSGHHYRLVLRTYRISQVDRNGEPIKVGFCV